MEWKNSAENLPGLSKRIVQEICAQRDLPRFSRRIDSFNFNSLRSYSAALTKKGAFVQLDIAYSQIWKISELTG